MALLVIEAPGAQAPAIRIGVGPNVRISRDGYANVEPHVSADPRDPRRLIAAAHLLRGAEGNPASRTYGSNDGGYTWVASDIHAEVRGMEGGDVITDYGVTGTAYLVNISIGARSMYVFRSETNGRTWGEPFKYHISDFEHMAVDRSGGAHHGRVYIVNEHLLARGKPGGDETGRVSGVELWYSDDDARSFKGPVLVGKRENRGFAAAGAFVLSDGTLLVGLTDYPLSLEKDATVQKMLFARSKDGGATFDDPTPVADFWTGLREDRQRQAQHFDSAGQRRFAVAPGGPYRDRVYGVWKDLRGNHPRLVLAYSSDQGRTWTAPKPIDSTRPEGASQFLPVVAVNQVGTVAVAWLDTRDVASRDGYHAWFAASVDGGDTFVPPARLSSAASVPLNEGNTRPSVTLATSDASGSAISLISAASRWYGGGDYMGMAAGADGVFHPVWPDARHGAFQTYTARVTVEPASTPVPAAPRDAALAEEKIDGRVAIDVDPLEWSGETREVVIPIRFRNTSTETFFPPIVATVTSLAAGAEILNAGNGKPGDGATMDYTRALRDLPALAPGTATETVGWRVRVPSRRANGIALRLSVTGRVAKGTP